MVGYLDRSPPDRIDARRPGVSLRDILFALRRHQWLILGCGLVGTLIGVSVLLAIPPSYMAESSLVLDARRPRLLDLPSLVSEQTTNPETAQLRSEVEILQSEDLAARVITRLGLVNHPEFQHHPSPLAALKEQAEAMVAAHFPQLAQRLSLLSNGPAPLPHGVGPQQVSLASAIAVYRAGLSVANDGRSYVIRVQYRSRDPQLAARIVNTHIQLYLADQVAFKQEIGKQTTAWLSRELSNLHTKLLSSEEAVQDFREENKIVQSGDTTLLAQQLAAVNAQLPLVEAERANQESRLKHAQDLLRRGMEDTQLDVIDSPLIQRLREQEAKVVGRQAELETVYGDQHPSVQVVNSELHDLRKSIRGEVDRIVKGLQNEVDVARTKENALRDRLVELEGRTVAADRAEGKLRDLQREVAANNSLIEVLLNRYKQVSAQEEIQQPDARVVSPASTPISPAFPTLHKQVPIILIVSLLFGASLAFLRELMRRGFKGPHEIELECELPSLGSLPMVPRAPRNSSPQDLVIDQPRSGFAEAMRYIRASIQATDLALAASPKTFLITSSLAHEGKSVLAMSLARSFAHSGKKTLVIDCDLRNPSMRKLVGKSAKDPDFVQVLSCEAHWLDAVDVDEKSGLHVLGTNAPIFAPQDLLSSAAMLELIEQCRRYYDVVILDSPPITAVSDALTLSRYVDATILAVRWGVTPREIAKTSLHKLFQSGARLCGAVLTQVDMRRGVFSPAEFEYYHKQNRTYYAH